MDFNIVVVAGSLVVAPEAAFEGTDMPQRLLLTVRSHDPVPRVDLLPIAAAPDQIPHGISAGDHLWVAGSLQRRFSPETGRSRLEVVAGHIEARTAAG